MKTVIEIEIFDDGQEPVTCCRDARYHDKICPMLIPYKYGQMHTCALFSNGLPLDRYEGKNGRGMGYLIPHPRCLEQRRKREDSIE